MKKFYSTLLALAGFLGTQAQNLPVPKMIKSGTSMMTAFPSLGIEFQGKYYCNAGGNLWMSDGTDAGTQLVKDIDAFKPTTIYAMCIANNKLFFAAEDGGGVELWVSDGTTSGTQIVKNINPNYSKRGVINTYSDYCLVVLNNEVFFYGHDAVNGVELWKSDGTEAGTKMVKNINQKPGASIIDTTTSLPRMGLVSHLNKVFFAANDSINGPELWVTDGTDAGTHMVKDIMPGNPAPTANTGPEFMVPFGNKLIFMVNETPSTAGLYLTDGTEPGTTKITMKAHTSDWFDHVIMNNKLYFYGRDDQNLQPGLWVTDGTESGTSLIKEGEVSGNNLSAKTNTASFLTAFNNKLYFSSKPNGSSAGEMELWVSDGSPGGTMLLKDLTPFNFFGNPYSSSIAQMTHFGGKIYFRANDTLRNNIWVTDGTDVGTQKITMVNTDVKIPGFGAKYQHARSPLTRIGNTLFFWNSYTSADSASLYKLDMFPDAITDVNNHNEVQLYPNPASNTLYISAEHASNVNICNMAGMIVKTTSLSKSQTELDIASLPAGLYTATILFNDGAKQVAKFVKQ